MMYPLDDAPSRAIIAPLHVAELGQQMPHTLRSGAIYNQPGDPTMRRLMRGIVNA